MLAKPKRITRKFYTDKFRPEVAAVIQEILVKEKTLFPMLRSVRSALQSAQRLTISDKDAIRDIAQLARELEIYQKEYDSYSSGDNSIDDINKIVSSTSDDPAQLNSAYKKLLGIVADLLFDLHQEYRSYTSNQRYAPIVKKLMEDLRNEDEKDKWDDIYRKQLDELQNVRDDARERYYELVEMIKAITYTIREIYKEEERKMIEQEKKFSAEECVNHHEEIRRAIYEKCADGEITFEEREQLLQNLQSMVLSEDSVEEIFENTINAYMEDYTSDEELDTVLTSIYEDHPSFAASILDEPIGRLYDMFHENTNDLYHNGLLSLEEAKYRSTIFDNLFNEEYAVRYSYMESADEEDVERLEKMDSLRTAYYNMLESATDALNAGNLTLEEFDSEIGRYADVYYKKSAQVLDYHSDRVITEGIVSLSVITAILIGLVASLVNSKIETKNVGTQRRALVDAYEYLHHPTVRWEDLTLVEPDDATISRLDLAVGQKVSQGWEIEMSYMYTYRGKPFISLTYVSTNAELEYDDERKWVRFVKCYNAEAKKHEMYYGSLIMLEGTNIVERDYTDFIRGILNDTKSAAKYESVVDDFYTEGVIDVSMIIPIALFTAALTSVVATPVGKTINRGLQRRSAKHLSKAYETLHNPKVKWSDLTVEKISMEYAAELDSSVADAMKKDSAVNGKAFLATYKGKPFISAVETRIRSTDGYGDVRSYGSHTHLKAYDAEAKKHSDYYASMLLLKKVGIMRPELKRFVKTIIKEVKVTAKETKAAKKFTKESAFNEYTVQALKESAETKIRQRYESGEISIDQREELLMQLHTESAEEFANRFFFDSSGINPFYERGKIFRNKKGLEPLQELQRKAKEALQNYEIDRKPKIQIKDLKLSKLSIKEAAKLDERIDLNSDPKQSVCALVSYNGKPIATVSLTKPKNKPDANGMLSINTYGEEGTKHRSYYVVIAYVYLLTPIDHPDIRLALTNFVKKYGNSTKNFLKYTARETWKSQFIRPNSKKQTDDDTSDYTEASSGNMYKDLLNFAVLDTEQRMRKNYLKNNSKEAKRIKTAMRLAKQKERQHVKYVNRFDKYLDTITDIKKLRYMKYDYPYDGIERKRIDIRIKELEKESRNE